MKRPGGHPSMVGDVLSSVLWRVDPEQQLRAYRIWTFWNDEVGDLIARRAQPARFRDGVLFVTVASHSWMQELRFLKDDLRDRLNARLNANLVHDIFFISGSVENEPDVVQPSVVEAIPAEPLVALPPIADPALADAFTRVLRARAKRLAPPRASRRRPKKPS
ncbi:MAG: DUF721 domain-containing protein [Candidatus Binatia bacterium]